jgi:16S rRNA (uracil1498-N3)-methyltransferase
VAPRFYAPLAERAGESIDLPDDEAVHLARVLRLSPGAAVGVFNGRGGEFDAVVGSVTKSGVQVHLSAAKAAPAVEPTVAVTVAQAVLKGDHMDDVVRDVTMLGAAAIQPIVTTRTEITLGAMERGRRRERWERVAISSCKQCGRATVPRVLPPVAFDRFIVQPAGEETVPRVMLVEPSASAAGAALREIAGPPPRAVTLVAGPEGGWTPDEIALATSVCRLATLGRRTIRADAAAMVGLAALFALWKEF